MTGKTREELRDYIFSQADDRARLVLTHSTSKADFLGVVGQVLDEYGLANRFETARQTNNKVRVLDVGCSEGLALHDVAEVLENRNLLEVADLNGLDKNVNVINTADEFAKVSKPPRPYLHFYLHDLTQPFDTCPTLQMEGKTSFDFIYAKGVLSYIPNARQNVGMLYGALKPGGVIYFCDLPTAESTDGVNGWIAPHPAMRRFFEAFSIFREKINNGLDVAKEQAGWLRELGAEKISVRVDPVASGDGTKEGIDRLRSWLMAFRNTAPMLVAHGFMTQAEIETAMTTLFREMSPTARGQTPVINTLARKPYTQI